MGQLPGQQQLSWQLQQSSLNQTVQGVWKPQAQQQAKPLAAAMYERPTQQQPIAQQQQHRVHCEQLQQGSVLQPSQHHSNQQQLQQQTMLNQLTHAPHHAGVPGQQPNGAAGAVAAAAAGSGAATKAPSVGNASLRPIARPVVHQDDKMLPYQQQAAVQQRKHAAQQQQKGSKQLLQSAGQTSIDNLFPVDYPKQQQMQEQRAQQQQALHHRQQQQQLAQVSAARQKQLQHQSRKQRTADPVEYAVDYLEILSDVEDAGSAPAAADAFSAQQQQQCRSWDVPHHQQQPAQQSEIYHQQSSHSLQHHHQQNHQQQHNPQQRSKPQVQTVEEPQEVLRLMALAWPGAGQQDGFLCPSQELSVCPASTAKGDSLGAPDRRVNAAAAK